MKATRKPKARGTSGSLPRLIASGERAKPAILESQSPCPAYAAKKGEQHFVRCDREEAFMRVRRRSIGIEDKIKSLEGGCISEAEFTKRLGLRSCQTVRSYRKKLRIFAWNEGKGTFRYPAWQIYKNRLLPGLSEILAILTKKTESCFSISDFLLTESCDLGGRRPLDLLRCNRIGDVRACAARYGEIGS